MGATFTMGLAASTEKAAKKMIPSAEPAHNSEPEDLGDNLKSGATKKKAIVSGSKQLPMLNKFTKSQNTTKR